MSVFYINFPKGFARLLPPVHTSTAVQRRRRRRRASDSEAFIRKTVGKILEDIWEEFVYMSQLWSDQNLFNTNVNN